ncbi:hypothetical protein [Ferriphaselus amnicola]|uniref:hypothetical protein n=1 Tax=Ferriphaselus amnicola TaxID=1188319 RepID=UPI00155961D7|nr:hypothetical protein [Ferriphaselus amnicola]
MTASHHATDELLNGSNMNSRIYCDLAVACHFRSLNTDAGKAHSLAMAGGGNLLKRLSGLSARMSAFSLLNNCVLFA